MKNYDQICEIITQRYGLTDLEKYKAWLAAWRAKGGTATQEEADLLSPDNINCRDFWRVCEDVFGADPICNAADGANYTTNMEANRLNLGIARSSGLLNIVDDMRFYRVRMLEYGPGLGCVKNYVEVNTKFDYAGFDVNPRIPDVMAATETGYIPTEFVDLNAGTFNIVLSSNVLQHVSWKQRVQFLADANRLLHKGGYLAFNIAVIKQDRETPRYMTLYGQFILIPEPDQIYKEIKEAGFEVVSNTNRLGYHYGFTLQKV